MTDKEIVKVRMFGDFEITFRGVVYNIGGSLSKQLINLLQYLMINHDKDVFNEALYDALWSDNKNPQNALKFTVHRLRDSLKKLFQDESIDWIITKKGGYAINDSFIYELDTDQLTSLVHTLENKTEFSAKDYKMALKVMDIYKGHLYVTSSQFFWIGQLAEWYRSAFANIVGRICKYLISIEEYAKMIELDYQAILREPFYEGLHYFYIQGLIETREYHKALQYYDEINEAFYKELGTGLSPRFKELYNILEEEHNNDDVLHILEVKNLLNENFEDSKNKKERSIGYYCTFDLFKYIYEISLKAAKRDKKKYYLILFGLIGDETIDKRGVFNHLRDIILRSIRSSDVCAKVNESQFVLLVQCTQYDDTFIIIQRILNQFYKSYSSRKYRLNHSVERINDKNQIDK